MKLKFKEQRYQDDAVKSVVDCFLGQVKGDRKDLFDRYKKTFGKGTILEETKEIEVFSFGNKDITLSDLDLKNNIKDVQNRNDINFTKDQDLKNFSIEMETGTGKTYTYIKTMYELNLAYGWSKFIIMTPSIAIREGVKKSFEITEDHFQELYHKKIKFFIYNSQNSSNIANINAFSSDNSIQVMIINYQVFSSKGKDNRRIYQELDELQSNKPIDVIKSVRPILIIDEPQKFGEKTESLFEEFNPLFILRYSATHKEKKEYNKIYRLDAVDAYNQKLVKKISAKGIEIINNNSIGAYLFLDDIVLSENNAPEANMEIEVNTKNGPKRKQMKIKLGDDLYQKSGEITAYKGFVVSDIKVGMVSFSNGKNIEVGELSGDTSDDDIKRIQIRETILSHFQKEKNLFKEGIKVLSLFFIDEVAKYKYYEEGNAKKGEYAKIFEEEYNSCLEELKINELDKERDKEYLEYLNSFETEKIHAGYFSIDKKTGHEIDSEIKKSKENKDYISEDTDAYDLIMKDKERLLSLEEPVRFIFSHSALREGWDNPNIFQICALKHSNSNISKRQEIGRGLRICVNNNGDRMDYDRLEKDFFNINTLTIISSESYDSFAKALQTEMAEAIVERPKNLTEDVFSGKVFTGNNGEKYELKGTKFNKFFLDFVNKGYVDSDSKITEKFKKDIENGKFETLPELEPYKEELCDFMKKRFLYNDVQLIENERKRNVKELLTNDNFLKKEFQDLWNKINIKTVYQVEFDSKELVKKSVETINRDLKINKMKIKIVEGTQKDDIDTVMIRTNESMKKTKSKDEEINASSQSQIKYDLIGEITKETNLTRKTIIEILSKIDDEKFDYFKVAPETFKREVSNIINREKATTIIDGITYHKIDDKYSNEIFTKNNLYGEIGVNACEVKKHIYNVLIYDSKNEKDFASELEVATDVTVYAKLPNGFKIPTPVGNYNPDWAIVIDHKNAKYKYVYFVAETKGSLDSMELREVEKAKINCARKHFKEISNESVKYGMVKDYKDLINLIS